MRHDFASKIEDTELYLECTIKTFRLIKESMENELFAIKKTGLFSGPESLLDHCDAMFIVLWELERIQNELSIVVDQAYGLKKES